MRSERSRYGAGTDEFLAGLVSRAEDHERARRFLTDALRSFDEAPFSPSTVSVCGLCITMRLRAGHSSTRNCWKMRQT